MIDVAAYRHENCSSRRLPTCSAWKYLNGNFGIACAKMTLCCAVCRWRHDHRRLLAYSWRHYIEIFVRKKTSICRFRRTSSFRDLTKSLGKNFWLNSFYIIYKEKLFQIFFNEVEQKEKRENKIIKKGEFYDNLRQLLMSGVL